MGAGSKSKLQVTLNDLAENAHLENKVQNEDTFMQQLVIPPELANHWNLRTERFMKKIWRLESKIRDIHSVIQGIASTASSLLEVATKKLETRLSANPKPLSKLESGKFLNRCCKKIDKLVEPWKTNYYHQHDSIAKKVRQIRTTLAEALQLEVNLTAAVVGVIPILDPEISIEALIACMHVVFRILGMDLDLKFLDADWREKYFNFRRKVVDGTADIDVCEKCLASVEAL